MKRLDLFGESLVEGAVEDTGICPSGGQVEVSFS